MLQKSTLFLHTAEAENYNEELDFNLTKTPSWSTSSIIVATCILISILGLIANGIIFWLLCCVIKRTTFTIYVLNVVASDFIAQMHSLIYLISWYVRDLATNRVFKIISMLLIIGYETDSYFLAVMSIERCLAVFSPAWYQSHRQKCSTIFICMFFWILSATLKLAVYFVCKRVQISDVSCDFTSKFKFSIIFVTISLMIFSNLALCIRMKIKPEDGFPARLDYSIWATVILHLILFPLVDIIRWIMDSYTSYTYENEFLYVDMITFRLGNTVNPFVYLVVGCWKWEKGQQPFYMFLERALKDDGKSSMRTQPDQEQVLE